MSDESLIGGTTPTTPDATPAAATPQPAATAPVDKPIEQPVDATQQQAAEGTKAEEAKAPEVKNEGAPETYEFKTPEGLKLDETVVAEFSTVAKELGLPQDAAQKIIDKLAPKIAERSATAQKDAIAALQTEWTNSTKADKEFGGDKLDANLSVAKKALDAFGTPELRTLLNETGLGNHPEIIRAFYRAGKTISEDSFVPGGKQPGKVDKSAAEALYG